MTTASAAAALPGFDTPAFAFAPEAMTKILDFLADDESRVETNQLQILAESFEKRAEKEGIARFTPENLGAFNQTMMVGPEYAAWVDNEKTMMIFGDAKKVVEDMTKAINGGGH